MPARKLTVVAMLALLALTAPAHAAFVSSLDADLNLNFGSDTLIGSIGLEWQPGSKGGKVNDYVLTDSNLSLNGVPLLQTSAPPIAFPNYGTTVEVFTKSLAPFGLVVFGVNTNVLPPNPTFSNFWLQGAPATSGTVTVLSETLATVPLPAALPMFASGLLALAGFAFFRMKRQFSA
jgi:hypothetical protein